MFFLAGFHRKCSAAESRLAAECDTGPDPGYFDGADPGCSLVHIDLAHILVKDLTEFARDRQIFPKSSYKKTKKILYK